MVPSLRIETDPFTATLRPEPRTGAPLELGGKGFSTYLNAARPAEAAQPSKNAPRAEDPDPAEPTPKVPDKAEATPDPKPESTKTEAPDPRPRAQEQEQEQEQEEPTKVEESKPKPLPPQPQPLGLEAALAPPQPKLPPSGFLPPEMASSLVEAAATPSPGPAVLDPRATAPNPIDAAVVSLEAKGEIPLPVVEPATAPLVSAPKPTLVPSEPLQVDIPAPVTKAAAPVAPAKTFLVSEQFSAESPNVAFTLPAEQHPLVREMMAQLRPEPEVLKLSSHLALEPKIQPEAKAPVQPSPEMPTKAEARPEEPPTAAAPSAREAQAPKTHGTEPGLTPTSPRNAAVALNPEALPTPVMQPLGTPSTVAPTLAAPAAVATAPHPAAVQVEGGIRWLLTKERSGAELQLHPESLGRITIQLRVDQGEVHARVWATEPSTLPLLQDHKAFLEVSLRQQGLSLGSFDLQQGQRGGQPQADPGSWQGNPRPVTGIAALDSGQDSPAIASTPSAYRGLIEVFA